MTSNSMGTFACPHCKRDTPHKHFIDSKGYIHDFMEPNKILGRGPGKYSELLPDPMPETPEPATYSELEAEIERLRPQAAMAEDFSRTISAQLDTIERLRAELEHAPIAKVTVAGGLVVRTGLYAPGLPDGEHDLYCEPVAAHETPAVTDAEYDRLLADHADMVRVAQEAQSEVARLSVDAARWQAFVRSTGHETDFSTGPGKPKDLFIKLNCTGCERYFESGAVDYEGTLNAAMDDEIKLQSRNRLPSKTSP